MFPSKRNKSSVIASFYDLLGLLQPLVVKFKSLFQNVCLSNIGWNEEINEHLKIKLSGNSILARLLGSVLKALEEDIPIDTIFAWTDSKVTLSWIRSVKKEFKTFVQNSVIEIRSLVKPENWYYCKTKLNPADIITRFDSRSYISKDTSWWKGPEFIRREKLVYVTRGMLGTSRKKPN